MTIDNPLSTGLPGLDKALKGIIAGDNVVWQVNSAEDYLAFVRPYVEHGLRTGQKVIYFRFAHHMPLVEAQDGVEIISLHPEEGFEAFLTEIHAVIERTGRGGFYVFDCLSELAVDWYSDQMLGNFFMLTCPYLYDVEAIAYFMLLRNHHSFHATAPIQDTAQVFLDVYRHRNRLYIHPLKVQHRYSPTMYMLHVWEGEDFRPVTESALIPEILTSVPWLQLHSSHYLLGVWNRAFLHAEEVQTLYERGHCAPERLREAFRRLLRMAVSRDDRVLELAERHLTLNDLINVGKRMIGTGLIGGKTVGMLLARAILLQAESKWKDILEQHDSFYIGSDVFYTFLVRNGIWWVRQKQRDPATFLEGAERARQRMLMGSFPEYIEHQFAHMLDYFGQSPIIVRSSSLLEDNFGNAFAGKYESVFCANQGPRAKRLEDFMSAVRTIYASTMSEKALSYRAARGLLQRDEQMALLVQRVSGKLYGNLFYPQLAGVGFSFNPYVWSEYIQPEAGMLRLVFGLGTRAVDRSDDDYTRVVALNDPTRRPEANFDEVRQYSQRRVEVLDLEANQKVSRDFNDVVRASPALPVDMFASVDQAAVERAAERGMALQSPQVLTFEKLFAQTDFVPRMREILQTVQDAYEYPVDMEFTANFFGPEPTRYKINLVQCRPLQVKGGGTVIEAIPQVDRADLVLEAHGAVIGPSRSCGVDRLVYVVPSVYGQLPINERYKVARLIGRICHTPDVRGKNLMLLGPGRWGTTTPSLGVPVSFADINTVTMLCEIVAMRDDLVPDVSLGTHFLNELVEMDILYLALFPSRSDNHLNRDFFETAPSRLTELLPDAAPWEHAIRVIDAPRPVRRAEDDSLIRLTADTIKQHVVCYRKDDGA